MCQIDGITITEKCEESGIDPTVEQNVKYNERESFENACYNHDTWETKNGNNPDDDIDKGHFQLNTIFEQMPLCGDQCFISDIIIQSTGQTKSCLTKCSHESGIPLMSTMGYCDWPKTESQTSSSPNTCRKRNPQSKWTEEETKRLKDAVLKHGTAKGNWPSIAKDVGTRNVSQCVNKWKSLEKRKWNSNDTERIKHYIAEGYTCNEIKMYMPDCTSTQICQHYRKLTSNQSRWQDWEYERLKELILTNTNLSFTEIGRVMLDNRHRDDVTCKWNVMARTLKAYNQIRWFQ